MAKIYGAGKVTARLQNASQKSVTLVGQALFVAGNMVESEAKHLLTLGSAGGHSGGKHQHTPSAPGTPPNNDSGVLASHIETTQPGPLHVQVSSNAPYAVIQELGGIIHHPGGTPYFMRDGLAVFVSKSGQGAYHTLPVTKPHDIVLPARPYMGPALRAKKKEVAALIKTAVDKALKG